MVIRMKEEILKYISSFYGNFNLSIKWKKKKKAKLKEDFFLVDKNQNGNTKLKDEEEQMIEYRGVFWLNFLIKALVTKC